MPISDPTGKWEEIRKASSTPSDGLVDMLEYSKCCIAGVDFVSARIDELDPSAPVDAHALIDAFNETPEARGGITGFQAGWISQMIAHFHTRGEEFRLAWNKKYRTEGEEDTGGTVNPAILTLVPKT